MRSKILVVCFAISAMAYAVLSASFIGIGDAISAAIIAFIAGIFFTIMLVVIELPPEHLVEKGVDM